MRADEVGDGTVDSVVPRTKGGRGELQSEEGKQENEKEDHGVVWGKLVTRRQPRRRSGRGRGRQESETQGGFVWVVSEGR
jgi:hypothetical protein